jgi:hypothetical protein
MLEFSSRIFFYENLLIHFHNCGVMYNKRYFMFLLICLAIIPVVYSNNNNLQAYSLEIPAVESQDDSANTNLAQTNSNNDTANNYEEFAMQVILEEHENPFLADDGYYEVDGFGLNLSPNSTLCPTNNCEFELEDGQLAPFLSGSYSFTGLLKIGIESEEGKRSKIMDLKANLDITETLENDDTKTEFVTGDLSITSSSGSSSSSGSESNALDQLNNLFKTNIQQTNSPQIAFAQGTSNNIEFRITNGSIAFDGDEATMILQGRE